MPDARQRLIVNVLGNAVLAASTAKTQHPLDLPNRKSRALLVVLATHDQKSISRERLAGMLWGGKAQAQAQGNLRNALYEVRRALTPHGLVAFINEDLDRHTVHIDHNLADVDLSQIFADLAQGKVNDLLLDRERIFDSFLDDLKHVDDEFEAWVVAKRTAYTRRAMDRVEDVMRAAATPLQTKVLAARALGNLDPSNEEAVRLRMRRLAEVGDSGAALTLFVQLSAYLDEQLGCEPSEPTLALNAAIKLGQVAVHTGFSDGGSALPPEPTLRLDPGVRLVIGVCAFDLAGVAEAARPYAQGFRTDLIGSLVQFREWDIHEPRRVWDPTTWPLGKNGEYIISGRATEDGGSIRLLLTLHDIETMKVVDRERIHVNRENWFTGQDIVIRRLARWLNLNVSEERIKALGRADKGHPPLAYDVWLKHDQGKHLFTQQQWYEAEAALLDLMTKHADFARAHASLAALYNTRHFVFPGIFRDQQVTERALTLARSSIRLEPHSVHGHRAAAYAYALLDHFELAEHHFRLVLELNENDIWGQISAAAGLGLCGKWDEAKTRIDCAIGSVRNPTPNMHAYLAFNCFALGDNAAAIKHAALAREVTSFRAVLVAANALAGEMATAKAEYDDLRAVLRRNWASNREPTDEALVAWLLHLSPMSKTDVQARLKTGLDLARSHHAVER